MKQYFLIGLLVMVLAFRGYAFFEQTQTMSHNSGPNPIDLFTGVPVEMQHTDPTLHFFDQKQAVIRFAEVLLNDVLTSPGKVFPGDEISLTLFADANYFAKVQTVNVNINNTLTIIAKINGFDFAWMIMTITGERCLVNINIPETGSFYQITSDPLSLQHYLVEMDIERQRVLQNSPPMIPDFLSEEELLEQRRIKERLEGRMLGPDDPANIDVMIVYTPSARDWANANGGGINNVVAQAVAKGQLVMANSQTIMTVTLVHSALINYTESGSSGIDLENFTFNNGTMDEVHAWRNTYGADLNALFTFVEDTGGLGWLLNNRYGADAYGFSITRVQQAGWTYTTIHEMGHNMGAHHHKEQLVQPGPTNWTNWPQNNWSAGWRWTGTNNGKFCSVMTYESGSYFPDGISHTRVPYFSNPSVSHEGTSTGHATDGDNARSLKAVKHYVAAYRTPTLAPAISITPGSLTETHSPAGQVTTQMLTIGNTGDGPLNFSITMAGKSLALPQPSEAAMDISYQVDNGQTNLTTQAKAVSGGMSPFLSDDEVIRWDNGVNQSALGQTGGGTFYVASYFPATTMSQYSGMKLHLVEIFISGNPNALELHVWGPGSPNTPGTLLHSQSVPAAANSWLMVTLTDPVLVTGQDLWIGYAVTHAAGVYPAGNDPGPAVAGFGDMLSFNGSVWSSVANNYGINRNWNIAGHLTDSWLSFAPGSGTVNPGNSVQIEVNFNSAGLENGIYNNTLAITSNASGSPHNVPVSLTVTALSPPTITTALVTGITASSAISGGDVTSQGSAPVTVRGVVWGTGDLPSIENHLGITYNGSGTGSFTSNLSSLNPGTTHFLRAYATNSAGTSYGNQLIFTTLSVHTISLPQGWTGLSSYLIPVDTDIETMFQSIVSDMEILQNETDVYWPVENVNTIVNWDSLDGYKIKMNNAAQFTVTGEVSSSKTLALSNGWNLMPVLSNNLVDVILLFAGQNVIIVKEVAGVKVYWPQMNANTIGSLQPGKSYWVLMEGSGLIVFP